MLARALVLALVVTSAAPAELPDLAEAHAGERTAIQRMLASPSWPRRALAAVRLLNFGCEESSSLLGNLRRDPAWQVRSFTVACLGHRHVPGEAGWFDAEDEPRVLRTALRYRYAVDRERLGRGVRALARRDDLREKMLAVELGAASGEAELIELARETARTIILRMDRAEAGALSPRLAAVTEAGDMRRDYKWKQWLMKTGRGFRVQPAYAVAEDETTIPLTPVQSLDTEAFVRLDDYMTSLEQRRIDLAICLDTTASMSGELAEAQGGVDDLMAFARDVVADLRIGLVAYRDRGSRYETKGWDFTADVDTARRRLWSLGADGGGDGPEAVLPALRDAFTKLTWLPAHTGVLVLVGDAPPHVGYGAHCVEYARRGREQAAITTHVIQAAGKDVPHFAEIAGAGGGQCVTLESRGTLMGQITGLTLGERYEEEFRWFFGAYLKLCR